MKNTLASQPKVGRCHRRPTVRQLGASSAAVSTVSGVGSHLHCAHATTERLDVPVTEGDNLFSKFLLEIQILGQKRSESGKSPSAKPSGSCVWAVPAHCKCSALVREIPSAILGAPLVSVSLGIGSRFLARPPPPAPHERPTGGLSSLTTPHIIDDRSRRSDPRHAANLLRDPLKQRQSPAPRVRWGRAPTAAYRVLAPSTLCRPPIPIPIPIPIPSGWPPH